MRRNGETRDAKRKDDDARKVREGHPILRTAQRERERRTSE